VFFIIYDESRRTPSSAPEPPTGGIELGKGPYRGVKRALKGALLAGKAVRKAVNFFEKKAYMCTATYKKILASRTTKVPPHYVGMGPPNG